MRMPRRAGRLAVATVVLAVATAGGASAQESTTPPSGAEGWQGLLGSRPVPQLGGRWIVVLRARSLADRVRAAGGVADEAQMKSWTATARIAQKRILARLAFKGAPVQPEHEYLRVLNGFAASIDTGALSVIERDPGVAGVYPVRAAYPAAVEPASGRSRRRSPGRRRPRRLRRLGCHDRARRHGCRLRSPVHRGRAPSGDRHRRPGWAGRAG